MKDDLISRQLAINAIEKKAYRHTYLDQIIDIVSELPSAQPEPCEDCVSRKDVIRLLHSGYHRKSMIEEVKELPSVQPKHSTGNWIPVTYRYVVKEGEFPKTKIEWQDATEPDDVEGMKCSECGTIYDFTEARNWCSECGADMRGEKNGHAST